MGLLGDKIRLKSWDKYRGGLDVKGDMTGMYSVYTIYEGHEVMFHVSTLLPYSKDNKQQVSAYDFLISTCPQPFAVKLEKLGKWIFSFNVDCDF